MKQLKQSPYLLILFLAGCSQAPAASQPVHNWFQLGQQDALQGKSLRKPQQLQAVKAQIQQPLNVMQYQLGWQQGVAEYCSTSNGYRLGANGIVYNNICPDSKISHFDHAWQRGLRDYCTPENGYRLGKSGRRYSGFCPPDLNVAFQRDYNYGYKEYQHILHIKSKIGELNAKLTMLPTSAKQQRFSIKDKRNALQKELQKLTQ